MKVHRNIEDMGGRRALGHKFGAELHCVNKHCTERWWHHQVAPTSCLGIPPKRNVLAAKRLLEMQREVDDGR